MIRSESSYRPFDAVLILSFGGPQGPEDVRPFLDNILRGRSAPPGRVEAIIANYMRYNGVSPITEITRRQAAGVRQRLADVGVELPVYVGMRNWHPYLADVMAEMSRAGVRRAIGFITAAHHSYASCGQYKENVREARRRLREQGLPDVEVTYVESWYDHPGFIGTLARHVRAAIERLEAPLRQKARIVFTAHSIPVVMAESCRYREQLQTTARTVGEELGRRDWALVYQSRSGRPQDPWLGPDINDYLKAEHEKGLEAVVVSPIGFICDHIEVLCDLDVKVGDLCRGIGLPMARAETVNDDPMFLDMMTDIVLRAWDRYKRFPPLTVAPR
ncbi:MAG: ferrochelatase [Phycisphaerae bacterium]